MRIESTKPVSGAGKGKTNKTGSSSGASFGKALSEASNSNAAEAPAPVSGPAATSDVGGLLAVQEVGDRAEQKKRAKAKATYTLDMLAQLQLSLLSGTIPAGLLSHITTVVEEQREMTDDPLLNALLDDIELRAAVEMAKIEMSLEPGLSNTLF